MRLFLALVLVLVGCACLLGLAATLEPLDSPWPWRALYGGLLALVLVGLSMALRAPPRPPEGP
jgi:peptidoglycan/LPS O-acetylase OafA/YrhL